MYTCRTTWLLPTGIHATCRSSPAAASRTVRSILKGTQFPVSVQNLLNSAPPLVRSIGKAVGANNRHYGDTIGRVIQVGLRKKF